MMWLKCHLRQHNVLKSSKEYHVQSNHRRTLYIVFIYIVLHSNSPNTWMSRATAFPIRLQCAPSIDSDQSAHPRSLIRVFAGHSVDSQESKASSDGQRSLYVQPVRVRVFAWRTCSLVGNAVSRLKCNYTYNCKNTPFNNWSSLFEKCPRTMAHPERN